MPADGIDHVVPRAYLRMMQATDLRLKRSDFRTVPACGHCNSVAGDRMVGGVAEKRAYIHKRLREKYAALLATPDWTPEQLAELGYVLRTAIEAREELKRQVRARLRWPTREAVS